MFLYSHLLFMSFDWRDDWITIREHDAAIIHYCCLWAGTRSDWQQGGGGARPSLARPLMEEARVKNPYHLYEFI